MLCKAIFQTGARLIFLPPYAPHHKPIEFCFGLLKKWIQKNANLVFPLYPDMVLGVAMRSCCLQPSRKPSEEYGVLNLYSNCGYDIKSLRNEKFQAQTYVSDCEDRD